MGPADVERLLADAAIIRNRAKIEATIANARAIVDLRRAGSGLSQIAWSYARDPVPPGRSLSDLPPYSEEARALSKELKKLGFRFVGPTTAYAAMQALGIVNDHLEGCHVREAVERARADFLAAREAEQR
jgi:DNA-3-methyladenine glycosylase I